MYDVAIIGAGPAGASAALITAKAGKKTLVLDNDKSITKRAWIENHYGVFEITGPDLVENGKKQAAKFGAELVQAEATGFEKTADGFTVTTADGQSYTARHLVLATGMSVALAEAAGVATEPGKEPRVAKIVKCDLLTGKTEVEGLWVAGVCAGTSLHTIVTAGDGAKVAINIVSELNGSRYVDHDVLKA